MSGGGAVWNVRTFAFFICANLCAFTNGSRSQEQKLQDFQHIYEQKVSEARTECTKLWSDRAFDSLRKRIPFNDEKPTFAMLKNPNKLKRHERALADLAIQTLEKCRKAWEPAYEMLPPDVRVRILNTERLQDARIAELYDGKITFGEFNIALSKLIDNVAASRSGVAQPTKTEIDEKISSAVQNESAAIPPSDKFAPGRRIALVIGNSNYANLPKLANPTNDAKAISELLSKMGYTSRLLLDSSEQNTRREIRQFASDSERAEAAIVYYAGHGAQVNGSNYLLPIDADVPRTEVDIQFSALKVDDLINSIHANTKVVFLDACRDNPAVYKNLARGRGSSPVGLAPAASSNFEQRAGGGLFIAYATDAGAVADDGQGKHSPFTEALLRNLRKPISIDDMFSLVTKEVRLITKNAQRPYKYASLENIFCLSPSCGAASGNPTGVSTAATDPVEQAAQSVEDELNVAKATKKVAALQYFLSKYPDAPNRKEVEALIESVKLSEFAEWTLFELVDRV
jgi:Caspase domain